MDKEPTGNLSPEDSQRVQEIAASLRSEFHTNRENDVTISRNTIKDIEDLKEDALVALRHTIKHEPNPNLKAKVAMWAIDHLIDAQASKDDPMSEFFREMSTHHTAAEKTP